MQKTNAFSSGFTYAGINNVSHTHPESVDQAFDQASQSFQLKDQLERPE